LSRLGEYIDQMLTAANDARRFIDGMSKEDFLADKRTQQAVMSLVIVGEAAARIMDKHSQFVADNSEIPWRGMRGMRNRVTHGYFDVNLDVVWDTIQTALPDLLEDLKADVAAIGVRRGALWYDDDLDELVRTEDSQAERHTYASATNRQKRGLLNGSLQEVREAIKETLDDAG
jgi:uncharacterized protein with HEPN domain